MAEGFFGAAETRGCFVCTLRGKKIVRGTGNPRAEVLLIGEGPGEKEELHGSPFQRSAPAGSRLTNDLLAIGLPREKVWMENVVRCRPTDPHGRNREPTDREVLACSIYLEDIIATLSPHVIVTLGNVATRALIGQAGMSNVHGTVWLYKDKIFVVPTFHPSGVNREEEANPERGANVAKQFRADLSLAASLLSVPLPKFKYRLAGSEDEALELLSLVLKKTAIDIEGYRPDRILMIAFSIGDEAIVIPVDHPQSPLDLRGKHSRVWSAIRDILIDPSIEKVGQNFNGFDRPIMELYFECDIASVGFDTMYGSYIHDERSNIHALDMVASRWANAGGYDWKFNEYLKANKISKMQLQHAALEVLAEYNARDAIVTFRSHTRMEKEFDESYRRLAFFTTEAALATHEMERVGIKFDINYSKELGRGYEKKLEELQNRVRVISNDRVFNVGSSDQVGKLVFDRLNLHENLSREDRDRLSLKTASGKWATDDVIISALLVSTGHEVLQCVKDYRDVQKDKSTYVDGLQKILKPDGRIHVPTLLHTCETGRATCRLHNVKKQFIEENGQKRYTLLDQFVAEDGWTLLKGDNSQSEMRVMAEMSGDPVLMEIYKEKKDFHHETATWLFGLKRGQKEDEEQRTLAKNCNFGLAYGLDEIGLYEYIRVKVPWVKLGKEEVAAFHRATYKKLKVLREWQLDTISFVRKHGYVVGLFGRTRHIDMAQGKHAENVAINSPIQGASHDILLVIMLDLYYTADRPFRILLDQHDAVILETPDSQLQSTAKHLENVMSHPSLEKWLGKSMKVPLVGDVKVGKRWGSMKKFEVVGESEWAKK